VISGEVERQDVEREHGWQQFEDMPEEIDAG
jgi:hypothetical protein